MKTLTKEGRILAAEVCAVDPELGARIGRWLNGVQVMEEIADERVSDAMASERAQVSGVVLPFQPMRVHGGMR